MKTTCEVISTKSVADLVDESDLPKWRKWLLSKLMPERLYEAPPSKLAEMQKGCVIGRVTLETIDCDSSASLDFGVSQ